MTSPRRATGTELRVWRSHLVHRRSKRTPTQHDLAAELGVDERTVRRWEAPAGVASRSRVPVLLSRAVLAWRPLTGYRLTSPARR